MRTRRSGYNGRRKLLAWAAREIRKRVGGSQASFAEKVGVEVGTISRWERGELAPTGRKREALLRLAEKNGLHDLARVVDDPIRNWKALLQESEPKGNDRIATVEIITINDFCLLDDAAQRLFHDLDVALARLEALLVAQAAAGEKITLFDEAQQTHWLRILERHGLKKRAAMTPAQIRKTLAPEAQKMLRKGEGDGKEAKKTR